MQGVHIEVEKDIPSSIGIKNQKAKVCYDGLRDKCFACQSQERRMNSCPTRNTTNAAITKAKETVTVEEELIEEETLEEPLEV